MKMDKKFYIGSLAALTKDYSKATVEEAIEAARERLAKDDRYDTVIIVQVIKMVKRVPPPCIVEDVE